MRGRPHCDCLRHHSTGGRLVETLGSEGLAPELARRLLVKLQALPRGALYATRHA